MREILFRGKGIKGFWNEGLLAHIGNAWYISNKAGVATAFEVIPETIGQYTGLTDKNGNKIFEGDILGFHTQSEILVNLCVVSWDDRDACWTLKMKTMSPRFFMHNPKAVEIIGNIHDNPELLEGTK